MRDDNFDFKKLNNELKSENRILTNKINNIENKQSAQLNEIEDLKQNQM